MSRKTDHSPSNNNRNVIQRLYNAFARGDRTTALEEMHETIDWNEADNFMYSNRNPYTSPQAVAEGVFGRLATDWEDYKATPSEIFEAGDTVVALGRSKGIHRGTRKLMDVQFAHIWRLNDGKIIGFQQYIDTLGVHQAMVS